MGSVDPEIRFPQQQRASMGTTQHVSILHEPFRDVFVSFSGLDMEGNAVVLIKFFPMQSWLWAGFALLMIGSAIAVWPRRAQAA